MLVAFACLTGTAIADSDGESLSLDKVAIHGFVSEGAFWSTDNDYIGASDRGSLELFEAALNVSSQLTDRLHAGIQLYARDIGDFDDEYPRVDWAYLDYHWRTELGLRAGVIKMPFGLYNEYADVDSARLSILMPQGIYPLRNREVVLSHRGFGLYGTKPLGGAGALDYQAWVGSLSVPEDALTLVGATLERTDTKYVTGGQVFWRTPLGGLRVGATYLRASIDFHVRLVDATTQQLIAGGLVPADFDGTLVVSQRPTQLGIASVEYVHGDTLIAAEYSRSITRQRTTLPTLIPTVENEPESFYVLATHRPSEHFEFGGYYSVDHVDVHDRKGRGMRFPKPYYAFQRDLAITLRYDVNDAWLWKLEGHFIDGVAQLDPTVNLDPKRHWGLFLLRTTVSF